ncbi:Surfeit locus 1/Shy1 [Kalmanozyma brasiliensis GHG001]|uniref:SURF1-like protein n=1 Tax=Kalmanozyma brasiliensis (strain GHG001) TaxID=1365824 RepID=V5EHV3_KALBG|nr:Surfeit locus 1/Shy1 [Kalmanozyma brasiliensis GHG001]EST10181.1 Surfeit locus 1/Shy1 [Kalmanozyma brasiliensis GHG001]
MRTTAQLQRALPLLSSSAFAAGPSYAVARTFPALRSPLPTTSHRPAFVAAPKLTPFAPRPFSSTSSRNEIYTDTPDSYSRPSSSKSSAPWYRSPTTLVLGFIPIFTFALGYWQIRRLKWKVSLIEELEDKLSRAPLTLPRNINTEVLPQFDFRLVTLKGEFDWERTMFVGPRVRDGVMGYHVVVPLRRTGGGGAVLVNRGFVDEKQIVESGEGRRLKEGAMETGSVQMTALLPRIYPANAFTPDNVPEKGSWFHVNPNEMAAWASGRAGVQALPLAEEDGYTPSAGVAESVKAMLGKGEGERVLPVYLEEVFDGNVGEAATRVAQGIPVGRAATIELRNQHAVYAATWFSLSACTAVMFGLLVRRRRS